MKGSVKEQNRGVTSARRGFAAATPEWVLLRSGRSRTMPDVDTGSTALAFVPRETLFALSLHEARRRYFQQPGWPGWPQQVCSLLALIQMFFAIILTLRSSGTGSCRFAVYFFTLGLLAGRGLHMIGLSFPDVRPLSAHPVPGRFNCLTQAGRRQVHTGA